MIEHIPMQYLSDKLCTSDMIYEDYDAAANTINED